VVKKRLKKGLKKAKMGFLGHDNPLLVTPTSFSQEVERMDN